MKWRPKEGWDRPLEMSPLGSTGYRKIDKFSYEAGADAMLEALREESAVRKYPYGWLVFIPNEGNNDQTG